MFNMTPLWTPSPSPIHSAPSAQTPAKLNAQHIICTVLVCDVVESVHWMQVNETLAIALWHAFVERLKQEVLTQHGARIVKSLGDGLMLEFSTPNTHNPRAALRAAHALQSIAQSVQSQQLETAEDNIAFEIRIGLHHTKVTVSEHDIHGHGVNLTSRITALAGPGEIVISSDLRDQLTDQIDADIEDMGNCYVKHIQEAVRVYRAKNAHSIRPSTFLLNEIGLGSGNSLPSINQYEVNWEVALAVLPFQNRGAEAVNQSLGDVLTDSLINKLSKSQTLRVISRLSTAAVANRQLTLIELQRILGVHYVVSGSFQSQGDKLIVMVELSDARTETILWAEQLREPIADLLDPHSALIGQAVNEIHAHILRTETKRNVLRPLPTIESYSLLLISITMMHRMSKTDFLKSRSMLEHLVERHPRNPIPLAWLARWHNLSIAQNWSDNPSKAVKYAHGLINKALDFDSEHALALSIKGLLHGYVEKDFDKAAKAYDAAISSNPSEPLAWIGYSSLNVWLGKGEQAVQSAYRALALSPLDPIRYYYESLTAGAMLSANRYEDAIRYAQKSIHSNAGLSSSCKVLVISQILNGQLLDGQATVKQLMQLEPNFTIAQFVNNSPLHKSIDGPRYAKALLAAGVPAI